MFHGHYVCKGKPSHVINNRPFELIFIVMSIIVSEISPFENRLVFREDAAAEPVPHPTVALRLVISHHLRTVDTSYL